MILAIDTATQYASLALYSQNGLFAEESWYAGRTHTVELMPRIVRILKLANLKVPNLTALAVSLGPGSFTGLRIGLAIAKGIALPHKLPVVGVPTLEIMAYPLRTNGLPVWAIIEAGRGRVLAGCYDLVENKWQSVVEPYLTNFEELSEKITTVGLCVGEINEEARQILEDNNPQSRLKVASPATRLRRAGYLAEIAASRLKEKVHQDSKSLVPIYPASP